MALKQPQLILISDGEYILKHSYFYQWEKDGRKLRLEVPKGFSTDIASVPWYLRSSGIGPDGLHRAASVVHDFLYYYKGKIPARYYKYKVDRPEEDFQFGVWVEIISTWSRKQCDKLFLKIMKEAGVNWVKRNTMYWAVRTFGKKYWNN